MQSLLKRNKRRFKLLLNQLGNKKKCYVCGKTFFRFGKFRYGSKAISDWLKKIEFIGSDVDNFRCVYCGVHDRERHLHMFFDKLKLWDRMTNSKILHFAPEKKLSDKIKLHSPSQYVKADLYHTNDEVKKIDVTVITFEDATFDMVICNHVLEHVPNYLKAMKEMFRVLKPGGIAILQTPFSKLLKSNFEEENINTDELRVFFYGKEDHVRIFGKYQFFQSLENIGFVLEVVRHKDLFTNIESTYYGVNKNEDLIRVKKPLKGIN